MSFLNNLAESSFLHTIGTVLLGYVIFQFIKLGFPIIVQNIQGFFRKF